MILANLPSFGDFSCSFSNLFCISTSALDIPLYWPFPGDGPLCFTSDFVAPWDSLSCKAATRLQHRTFVFTYIAADKNFLISLRKYTQKHLSKANLLSTHNIFFCGQIKKWSWYITLCHGSHLGYQIRLPLAIENLMFEEFQDCHHGCHLGYWNWTN